MNTSKCKSCGAEIVWAITATGAKIPLDAKPVVYHIIPREDGPPQAVKIADQADLAVSHFATCPHANRHSKGGKD